MLLLIGEGGGSKTDWVLIQDGIISDRFRTESYHPSIWNDMFFEQSSRYWEDILSGKDVSIKLFCAGCLRRDNAKLLEQHFEAMGYQVEVKSDLDAAGIALFGLNGSGIGGILGTGSVVFNFQDGKIDRIIGGKGHLEGDEGSAYYFGKLILQLFDSGGLSQEQSKVLLNEFQLSDRPSFEEKYQVAQLAEKLSGFNLFDDVHDKNIQAFIEKHQIANFKSIALVGSYAWYQRDRIERLLLANGCQLGEVLQQPIDRLVECFANFNE